SFSARRVAAIQNGKPIFYMTASFQAPENGYEHQKAMPAAPSPQLTSQRSARVYSFSRFSSEVQDQALLSMTLLQVQRLQHLPY
ncbi:hypothetical protein ACXWSA_09655, partial [Streptococcus pyogenes]